MRATLISTVLLLSIGRRLTVEDELPGIHRTCHREGRERVSESEARVHAQAVLSTLREAVDRGELAEVFVELWHDAEYDALSAEPEVEPSRSAAVDDGKPGLGSQGGLHGGH
jgi:hypothetical protein